MSLAAKIKIGLAVLLVIAMGGVAFYIHGVKADLRSKQAEVDTLQDTVLDLEGEVKRQNTALEALKKANTTKVKNEAKANKSDDVYSANAALGQLRD